jgi:hypothetical protein
MEVREEFLKSSEKLLDLWLGKHEYAVSSSKCDVENDIPISSLIRQDRLGLGAKTNTPNTKLKVVEDKVSAKILPKRTREQFQEREELKSESSVYEEEDLDEVRPGMKQESSKSFQAIQLQVLQKAKEEMERKKKKKKRSN